MWKKDYMVALISAIHRFFYITIISRKYLYTGQYALWERSQMNKDNLIILDVETAGTDIYSDEIIQVSIINEQGEILLDSYVKPQKHSEWKKAEAIHGITLEMVVNSPVIEQLKEKIQNIIDEADIIVGYNIDAFDIPFLEESAGINFKDKDTYDVMLAFAPIYGDYNEYYGNYKWQSLSTCASYYNYEFNAHNSLEDTKATLYCYQKIKEYKDEIDMIVDEIKQCIHM